MTRAALAPVSVLLALTRASGRETTAPAGFEVIATGVPPPLQLLLDRRTLVVLGPGSRGDSAGEIYRLELGAFPIDVARLPRVRVPFLDGRLATLGSMALEPFSRDLFLGEGKIGR